MKALLSSLTVIGLFALLAFTSNTKSTEPKEPRIPDDQAAIVINGNIGASELKAANGCGIGNFLIPTKGDTSANIPPMLWSLGGWGSGAIITDTIPGTIIHGVSFLREGWANTSIISSYPGYTYVVISDIGLYSYQLPDYQGFSPGQEGLLLLDSVSMPDIKKVANHVTTESSDPIVILVGDSLNGQSVQFYDYPGLTFNFSFNFPFEPDIFELTNDGLFITAEDSLGHYTLFHYSQHQDSLIQTYQINEVTSYPQEFISGNGAYHILSSPGDSSVVITSVAHQTGAISSTVIYSQSGARATYNEFMTDRYFTFQPIFHIDSFLNRQILIFDPENSSLDTFLVHTELDYFKHPMEEFAGFGYFFLNWIGAKKGGSNIDTVIIEQGNDDILLPVSNNPDFINATYGCWGGIASPDKIKFDYYPNPTSDNVTIHLNGLNKGQQYELQITDLNGRLIFSTDVQAYKTEQLQLSELEKGHYVMTLFSGQKLISKKLIIQ